MTQRARCAFMSDDAACRRYAVGGTMCPLHDPARAEQRRAQMSRLGRRGAAVKASQKQAQACAPVPLRTPDACFAQLEKLAAVAQACRGGTVEKVRAGVQVVQAAAQLIRDDLDRQVRELADLIEKYTQQQQETKQ